MNIYIIDAKRIATGTYLKTLANTHPAEYGSAIVRRLIDDNKININTVDELICGNILSAGLKQNLGRQIAIKAGLPQEICGYSINMLCGSGIKAIMQGYAQIKSGLANIIIAGGAEAMSFAPYLDMKARQGARLGEYKVIDHILNDALTDAFSGVHMGITAENIAEQYGITREMQDKFSLKSQEKALAAIEKGYFKDEIVPVTIKSRKGDIVFDTDEYPNKETNLEKLNSLKPAFKKDGTVTAGNSSGINDGAAFTVLASEDAIKKHKLKPMAKIVGCAQAGLDPKVMGLGPAFAIEKLLKKVDMSIEDIDIFELNEAFAAQSIGAVKEMANIFGVSEQSILDKTNYCGGAIALGHPVGASGARITTTLLYEMKRSNCKYGVASLCIGGGMGVALLIENLLYKEK